MSKLWLCLMVTVLLAAALPAMAQGDASWADRISLNGFFQTRYEDRDGAGWGGAKDEFTLNRLFVTAVINANERTMGVITWTRLGAAPTNVDWANIFVDYAINETWTVRGGQAGCWFGLECWQSSSKRIALERARVVGVGGAGVYFAGPWDRGVWFIRKPADTQEPLVVLGVSNGQFRAADVDNSKNLTIDLKWDQPWGLCGVSWLSGKYTNGSPVAFQGLLPGATGQRNAVVGYVRWEPPEYGWAFQGEYVDGKVGTDIGGWYVQVERSGLTEGGTAFVKIERYDPNDKAANDDYKAVHVGYSQWLDENNELTLQYTDGENAKANQNEIGLQWQFGFK